MTSVLEEASRSTSPAIPLRPEVSFPIDPQLSELPGLFDSDWIWRAYCREFGRPKVDPKDIRIRQFAHRVGRTALVSYEMEWDADTYLPLQHFYAYLERSRPIELSRFPHDRRLPGLPDASHPDTALALLNRHVLPFRERRAAVDVIRYRAMNRAVLRHRAGRAKFYARVMRPDAVVPLLRAHDLMAQSGFVAPRLAGHWAEGGVVWFSEIPGKNLRQQIRRDKAPEPSLLLDGLQTLWDTPPDPGTNPSFNLAGAYERAKSSIGQNVQDDETSLRELNGARQLLDPFVHSWRPTGIAHNDFYDDQMLVFDDGRIAVVDFEEAGLGDPLLDIGNFLAHLNWAGAFGSERRAGRFAAYHTSFREAALERFGWSEPELAYREAICLFRLCTNTIRRAREDWSHRLRDGLRLVNETLG